MEKLKNCILQEINGIIDVKRIRKIYCITKNLIQHYVFEDEQKQQIIVLKS